MIDRLDPLPRLDQADQRAGKGYERGVLIGLALLATESRKVILEGVVEQQVINLPLGVQGGEAQLFQPLPPSEGERAKSLAAGVNLAVPPSPAVRVLGLPRAWLPFIVVLPLVPLFWFHVGEAGIATTTAVRQARKAGRLFPELNLEVRRFDGIQPDKVAAVRKVRALVNAECFLDQLILEPMRVAVLPDDRNPSLHLELARWTRWRWEYLLELREAIAVTTVLKELKTPVPPMDAGARATLTKIETAAPGLDFDRAYITAQYENHVFLRDLATAYLANTTPNEPTFPEQQGRHLATLALNQFTEHVELTARILKELEG